MNRVIVWMLRGDRSISRAQVDSALIKGEPADEARVLADLQRRFHGVTDWTFPELKKP